MKEALQGRCGNSKSEKKLLTGGMSKHIHLHGPLSQSTAPPRVLRLRALGRECRPVLFKPHPIRSRIHLFLALL